MNTARQRRAGQLPLLLGPESIAQEIVDSRRARLGRGAELEEIDQEVQRHFGLDLAALGMDEVGTPDVFGEPPALDFIR